MNKVNLIGVGTKKSATTWLYKCLSEHPDICMSSRKETHFFSRDHNFIKGLNHYHKYWEHCNGKKYRGEFSVTYLSSDIARERIKEYNRDAKLIVCLRNPVDRAFSDMLHFISNGELDKDVSIEKAVEKYPEIIENGKYYKYLKRYFNDFPRENIFIALQDDIAKEPEKVIRELFDFLRVNSDFKPSLLHKRYHTARERSSFLYIYINRIYSFLQKHRMGRHLMDLLRRMNINSARINDIAKRFGKKERKMTQEEKECIKKHYKCLSELSELIGRDLNAWND